MEHSRSIKRKFQWYMFIINFLHRFDDDQVAREWKFKKFYRYFLSFNLLDPCLMMMMIEKLLKIESVDVEKWNENCAKLHLYISLSFSTHSCQRTNEKKIRYLRTYSSPYLLSIKRGKIISKDRIVIILESFNKTNSPSYHWDNKCEK